MLLLTIAVGTFLLVALINTPNGKAKPELSFVGCTNGTWTFTCTNGTRQTFAVREIENLYNGRPVLLWPHSAFTLDITDQVGTSNLTVGLWCVRTKNDPLTLLRIACASAAPAKWCPWHPALWHLRIQPLETGFGIWSDSGGGRSAPVMVGSTVPNIQMARFPDDTIEHLADYAGRVVILQFWATWSKRSEDAVTALQKLRHDHPGWEGSVVMVTANVDGASIPAAHLVRSNGWGEMHNVWLDFKRFKMCRVGQLPTTFIVDRRGKLVAAGNLANLQEIVERLVRAKE